MTSQNPSELISLPQGGGALRGIGETFAPDLHTGTGNYRIPLEIPAGRNGLQPRLDLGYSSGNGNGPFGLGWALDVPGVQRKTSRGIPRYGDDDVFILSGAEDLIPVPGGGPGQTFYRPKTEGLFARIVHHIESGSDYWEVWSKDGLRSRYGNPRPANAPANWRDSAIVADSYGNHIFAWRLSETVDLIGNRIEYLYIPGEQGEAQIYLSEVRYADYGADPTGFLVSIRFNSDASPRPDPFSDRRPGFEVRTSRRYTSIETWITTNQPILARTVHLEYLTIATNGVSLLGKIWVEGHDGTASQSLAPLEFAYTTWDPQSRRYQPLDAPDSSLPDESLAHRDLNLIDLFGDGLQSVLQLNGRARFWRNVGQGRFDPPRSLPFAPPASLGTPGVQIADFNGDGRPDLLVTDVRGSGYYPLATDGGFDSRGYVRLRQSPSFELTDPLVRLVDLDGDGVTDALRTGSSFELFYNDPQEGFTRVETRPRSTTVPDVTFGDPHVLLADFTGDGLTDIALVYDRRVEYWPYLGYGQWGPKVVMENSPHFQDTAVYGTTGFDPRRLLAADVDGDGCADLVYVGNGETTVWVNRSGNGFADPMVIQGTPPVDDLSAVHAADMAGCGTAGVLWSYDLGTRHGSTYKFLDLTGSIKPYLLSSIDNHMGATTTIEYTSSTRYAIADKQAGQPWKTTLPFPVQVVSRVTVFDTFSQSTLVSEFDYHHGYWDGGDREFRGFGRTDQRDALSFASTAESEPSSPPTELRTWFHLGPVGPDFGAWRELDLSSEFWQEDPVLLGGTDLFSLPASLPRRALRDAYRTLRGSILRKELYALDRSPDQNRPFTVEEYQYGVTTVVDGQAFFPQSLASRTTQWERGSEPMTRASFTANYDQYGRPAWSANIAAPRVAGPYLTTITRTTYATRDDDTHYLVNRVTSVEHDELINDGSLSLLKMRDAALQGTLPTNLLSLQLNYYDGAPFVGLPLGQIGDWGLSVRTEQLVLTPSVLLAAYQSGDSSASPPPYLPTSAGDTPAWTGEYPQAFRDALPAGAGYMYHPDVVPYHAGWYAQTMRTSYDIQVNTSGRGLPIAQLDPLGNQTGISYDSYQFLPAVVTDAVGLTRTAIYDYRVLQPQLVTDTNSNQTQVGYTPLGLPSWIAVMGKTGINEGDTPDQPGTWFDYGLTAWDESLANARQPAWVHTTRRVHHRWQLVDAENASRTQQGLPPLTPTEILALFPSDEVVQFPDRFLQTCEYSDGFGRLLQKRTQAEDVLFDDPTLAQPIFGDAGLPADQNAAPTDAVGIQASATTPFVAVSGWQVYDNKGRVVEKYEPFFSTGWAYNAPLDRQMGQKATMYYDPRGQVIRTVNPDGSEQLVIYGIPIDLTNPNQYTPTPWEAYTYDANDNAGRTHPTTSQAYQTHWNTPSSLVIDALGHTIQQTTRNGSTGTTDWFTTNSTYDIRGNLLSVTDPLGRLAFRYIYDLTNKPWRSEQLDAGTRRSVLDATGNIIEQRDSKGALLLHASDLLKRPRLLWARDNTNGSVTLRERLEYGDGSDPQQPATDRETNRQLNRLGKPARHYDEAGQLDFAHYDFKGNLLAKTRQVINDASLLTVFNQIPSGGTIQPFQVDWQPPAGTTLAQLAGTLLDTTTPYTTTSEYDALNRITSLTYPEDADGSGRQKVLTPTYNRAGALEQVALSGQIYVERIAYNAKGQRILISYGNGLMTRYAYDRQTFRLLRLRTEHYTNPTTLTYHAGGPPLQDLGYTYDLVGNILNIQDRTPGCGILNNPQASSIGNPQMAQLLVSGDTLLRAFTYDPLYRLLSANGRECTTIPRPRPWEGYSTCGFDSGKQGTPNQDNAPQMTSLYSEMYTYDPAGNMLTLTHQSGSTTWTRASGMGGLTPPQWQQAWQSHLNTTSPWTNPPGNGLTHVEDNSSTSTQTHFYDENGNLVRETTSRNFVWDYSDRLRAYYTQAGNGTPTLYVQYLYDSAGQRVKKLVHPSSGNYDATVYIDNIFEQYRWQETGGTVKQNNHIHIMDNQQRIALQRIGDVPTDDHGPPIQYQLSDHLGSSSMVLDSAGNWVNREEYFPYGETSFGSFSKKRYRFTNKERDEESGLYYHGARYYAPWLCRWVSCDPAGMVDGIHLYRYTRNSPLNFVDKSGNLAGGPVAAEEITKVVGAFFTETAPIQEIPIANLIVDAAMAWGVAIVAGTYDIQALLSTSQDKEFWDRQAHSWWANGAITDEEYLHYRTSGKLPSSLSVERTPSLKHPLISKQGQSPTATCHPSSITQNVDFSRFAQKAFAAKFSETPEIKAIWDRAALGQPDTKAGFKKARGQFWKIVNEGNGKDAAVVKQILEEAGYVLQDGKKAPLLSMQCWDNKTSREITDRRLTIDHISAQSADLEKVLDSDNLRFMSHRDNSTRGNHYGMDDKPIQ